MVSETEDIKWMKHALVLAEEALEKGEFPVGCILVADNQIVGQGARQHSREGALNELDHGEIVALRNWLLSGVEKNGKLIAYTTMEPCLMCLGALILNGVDKIVYAYEDVMGGAAGLDRTRPLTGSLDMIKNTMIQEIQREHLYREDKIEIIGGICRQESLSLFKKFFQDQRNSYWSNSLLARYTLNAK